ncbi:hypothetical protein N7451_012440 [Penicillium sp. IBT 35674x]|nr:hypothetical protein N7451_012440 [Penicillium sp. IBT 35674x]
MAQYIHSPSSPAPQPNLPYQTPASQPILNKGSQTSTGGQITSSPIQDIGQYYPNESASGNGQGRPNGLDDGQYHPNQQAPASTSDNGQHHSNQQPAKDQSQPNQPPIATQDAPVSQSGYVGDNQFPQASGENIGASSQMPSSTASVPEPPPPTQQPSLVTASQADPDATLLPAHSASRSPGNTAKSASIAHAVLLATGFIAALILFPLHKRCKFLQKKLSESQASHTADNPPRGGFLSNMQAHGAQAVSSVANDLRAKEHKITGVANTLGRIRRALSKPNWDHKQECFSVPENPPFVTVMDSVSSRNSMSDIYRAGTIERCKSPATTGSQKTLVHFPVRVVSSSPTLSETQSEHSCSQRTETSGQNCTYGPGFVENPSIENLLSASPLINNVYTVEMAFFPRKHGQLELQQGQPLCITRVFDNGWVS